MSSQLPQALASASSPRAVGRRSSTSFAFGRRTGAAGSTLMFFGGQRLSASRIGGGGGEAQLLRRLASPRLAGIRRFGGMFWCLY